MSWARQGDNARSHPVMMRVRSLASDDREPLELFGFIAQLYEYSGEHATDYVIEVGATVQVADGGRDQSERLCALAVRAGVMRKVKAHGLPAFELLRDEAFFHILTKAERERKLQHRNDTRDTGLTSQVRVRDGDECRWCGKVISFANTRGHNGGTYDRTDREVGSMDHLDKNPATEATMVVACLACNKRRGAPDTASADWQLRPAPVHPFYSSRTVEFLARNGFHVTPSERPGFVPDTAPATPHPAGQRAVATRPPAGYRDLVDLAASQITTGGVDVLVVPGQDPPGPGSVGARSAGSGRDGPGGVVGWGGAARGNSTGGRRARRGKGPRDG